MLAAIKDANADPFTDLGEGLTFDVAPSAYVPAGTAVTSFSFLVIQGKTARVRVGLALPPADAATSDSGSSDAGVSDPGPVSP